MAAVQLLERVEGVTAMQAVQLLDHGIVEGVTDERACNTSDTAAQDTGSNESNGSTCNRADRAGDETNGCADPSTSESSGYATSSTGYGTNGATDMSAHRQRFKLLGMTLGTAEACGQLF